MSYPRFTGASFPEAMNRYRVPLLRPAPCDQTLILFSVDWEKDHGVWRHSGQQVDCGGIRRGTPVLCELLDELAIPCTWFVECNSSIPEMDMVTACQEQFGLIASRVGDEIALHVHWGNHKQADGSPIDLSNRRWVQDEVRSTTATLAAAAGQPILSFRSGGHLAVPGLPGMLQSLGYLFDGSAEDRRGSRMRRLHSLLGVTTDSYHPDPESCVRRGRSAILEVPTSLHLHDFARLRSAWRKLFPLCRQKIISVYIHIDELTRPDSGLDEAAELDERRLSGLRTLLQDWSAEPRLHWVTAGEAVRRLLEAADVALPVTSKVTL